VTDRMLETRNEFLQSLLDPIPDDVTVDGLRARVDDYEHRLDAAIEAALAAGQFDEAVWLGTEMYPMIRRIRLFVENYPWRRA
jgi:hypothetical protein